MEYKNVSNIKNLECSREGVFKYKGHPKKVIFPYTVAGRKATARVMIMIEGKSHYWQAAKLVAKTWIIGYDESDFITYKDGDIHNIAADNLILTDEKCFYDYIRRNSGHIADNLEERKRKLQLVIEEASMTLNYFRTLNMTQINNHVKDYLYHCLMAYAIRTLNMGERTALEQVPEALAIMYECIMNGMCLYNYERYCKKLLHNYKKNGTFGFTGKVPKPIRINVEQLNLDCLWERYKVSTFRNQNVHTQKLHASGCGTPSMFDDK